MSQIKGYNDEIYNKNNLSAMKESNYSFIRQLIQSIPIIWNKEIRFKRRKFIKFIQSLQIITLLFDEQNYVDQKNFGQQNFSKFYYQKYIILDVIFILHKEFNLFQKKSNSANSQRFEEDGYRFERNFLYMSISNNLNIPFLTSKNFFTSISFQDNQLLML
ncbi:unnamed protein product [Paramecium sonneborni]|uniref:Uncharacterized protein n=1 Tax=Paramecium sonneborni TaxID=65129 RepID=A0A8S1PP67_9CILI|nr:unnamed protein product [Paramecium sonneborni]